MVERERERESEREIYKQHNLRGGCVWALGEREKPVFFVVRGERERERE